jgi:hypothetical protein
VIFYWREAVIRGLTSLEALSQTPVRPVGFFKFQTTDNSPGGINPATRSAWTCAHPVGSNTGSVFFLKTSFKLWSPEEASKKTLITK